MASVRTFFEGEYIARGVVSDANTRHRNNMRGKSHAVLISNPFSFMKHQEAKWSLLPKRVRKREIIERSCKCLSLIQTVKPQIPFLKILTVYFPQRPWQSQRSLKTKLLEKKLVCSLNKPCLCWTAAYLPSKESTILPGVLGSLLSRDKNSSTERL